MSQKYKTLFGPVPSRRLGLSLGIDFFSKKICSLNCVYCEVGPTVQLTAKPDAFIPYTEILSECESFFNSGQTTDYLTICGSGEPTLSEDLGVLVKELKTRYPDKRVAIITNGTLLHKEEVFNRVLEADLIMPSLDAVSEDVFEKINKPDPELTAKVMLGSIERLCKEFKGEVWLEILFIRGYNDHQEEIKKLIEASIRMKPTRVQLNTLVRPGVLKDILPLSKSELDSIAKQFPTDMHVEVITPSTFKTEHLSKEQVIEAIKRRPCSFNDISGMVGSELNANKLLTSLENEKLIKKRVVGETTYYSVSRLKAI